MVSKSAEEFRGNILEYINDVEDGFVGILEGYRAEVLNPDKDTKSLSDAARFFGNILYDDGILNAILGIGETNLSEEHLASIVGSKRPVDRGGFESKVTAVLKKYIAAAADEEVTSATMKKVEADIGIMVLRLEKWYSHICHEAEAVGAQQAIQRAESLHAESSKEVQELNATHQEEKRRLQEEYEQYQQESQDLLLAQRTEMEESRVFALEQQALAFSLEKEAIEAEKATLEVEVTEIKEAAALSNRKLVLSKDKELAEVSKRYQEKLDDAAKDREKAVLEVEEKLRKVLVSSGEDAQALKDEYEAKILELVSERQQYVDLAAQERQKYLLESRRLLDQSDAEHRTELDKQHDELILDFENQTRVQEEEFDRQIMSLKDAQKVELSQQKKASEQVIAQVESELDQAIMDQYSVKKEEDVSAEYNDALYNSAVTVFDTGFENNYSGWLEQIQKLYVQTVGSMGYVLPDSVENSAAMKNLLSVIQKSAGKFGLEIELATIEDLIGLDIQAFGIDAQKLTKQIKAETKILKQVLLTTILPSSNVSEVAAYVNHEDTQEFIAVMAKLRLLTLKLSKSCLQEVQILTEKRLLLNDFTTVDLEKSETFKELYHAVTKVELVESNTANAPADLLRALNLRDNEEGGHVSLLSEYFGASYDDVISRLITDQRNIFKRKSQRGYSYVKDDKGVAYQILDCYQEQQDIECFVALQKERSDFAGLSSQLEGFYHERFDYFRVEQYMGSISDMSLEDKVTLSNLLKEYIYAFKNASAKVYAKSRRPEATQDERENAGAAVVTASMRALVDYKSRESANQSSGRVDQLADELASVDPRGNGPALLSEAAENHAVAVGKKIKASLVERKAKVVQFFLSLEKLSEVLVQEIENSLPPVNALRNDLASNKKIADYVPEDDATVLYSGEDIEQAADKVSELKESLATLSQIGLPIVKLRENHRSKALSNEVTERYEGLVEEHFSQDNRVTNFVTQVQERSQVAGDITH